MEKNPCDGCDLCCRHIAVEIDKPENKKEFDQIRWFLLHEDIWVFIDNDDSWNLQVNRPCTKLVLSKGQAEGGRRKADYICGDYEKRPQICRDYSAKGCERNGDGDSFKVMWKSLEEFEEWVLGGKIIPKD
jgi:hypothetical protein